MIPFATADLEANDWNQFRVGSIRTSEGDRESYFTVDRWEKRIRQLRRRVFLHYGGRYDFFFFPPLQSICLSGSGILRAQHGQARLYDSFFLMQMSLEKIGKSVGIEKFKGKSDRVEELSDDELRLHCENDCEVLWKAIHDHQAFCATLPHEKPRWPSTAGGTAVYALEALERDGVALMAGQSVEVGEWLEWSQCATGARVEFFQIGRRAGPIYCYDINSSYPQSWLDAPLPHGPWVRVDRQGENRQGVYLIDVQQNRKHLPIVAPEKKWQYNGQCWATTEEIDALRETGARLKILKGWESEYTAWFGRNFATTLYARKQKGEAFAKVSINSAHGKTGQSILQSMYFLRPDGSYVIDRELTFPSWYQRPLLEAFVLSRARLRLWRVMDALRLRGWRNFYCDTDCAHTDCPPEEFPGKIGEGLGEWKLENVAQAATYVAPKVYVLYMQDGQKLVAKGFPKGNKRSPGILPEHLESAARGTPVEIKWRGGLNTFKSLKSWAPIVKVTERVLTAQTGSKRLGKNGNLYYE